MLSTRQRLAQSQTKLIGPFAFEPTKAGDSAVQLLLSSSILSEVESVTIHFQAVMPEIAVGNEELSVHVQQLDTMPSLRQEWPIINLRAEEHAGKAPGDDSSASLEDGEDVYGVDAEDEDDACWRAFFPITNKREGMPLLVQHVALAVLREDRPAGQEPQWFADGINTESIEVPMDYRVTARPANATLAFPHRLTHDEPMDWVLQVCGPRPEWSSATPWPRSSRFRIGLVVMSTGTS